MLVLLCPARVLTYFFTRPVTLALRLFGNMFAGHLLLVLLHHRVPSTSSCTPGARATSRVGIITYVMAFVMTVFEILVEFLQAYIFVLLAALYIAGSLADEH